MTKKRMFEGTNLDNKIPKKANFQSMYDENFSELCTFYGLDAESLLKDKTSPWRELSHKLMEHLIPGFQPNQSGRPPKRTVDDDYDLYLNVEVLNEFDNLSNPDERKLLKRDIHAIAIEKGLKYNKVRAARNRILKLMKQGIDPQQKYKDEYKE